MKKIILIFLIVTLFGCAKKLDLKPESTLVIPTTVKDFQNLLDNADELINVTPALAQLSSDEYYIPDFSTWQSLSSEIQRTTYVWAKDIFAGQVRSRSWLVPYSQVFYANSVLDAIGKQGNELSTEMKNIKGWALFVRAHAFFTLVCNYSPAYHVSTATTDLGIPLKLSANITEIVQRSNLQQTYDQIITDLLEATELLKTEITADKKNRPSKVAAYALLARIFLNMRDYEKADLYSSNALNLYSTLTDYNTLEILDYGTFTKNAEETIYFTHCSGEYAETIFTQGDYYGVDSSLIRLYDPSDLRLPIYFSKTELGNYNVKGINTDFAYPFTGLATDEIYLIKAECLARKGLTSQALSYLNSLVRNRMKAGTFTPISAADSQDALDKILLERRKELIWRGLRWLDLKRLNKEGSNITLHRNLGDQKFTLEPNSPRYVFPIPDDEIGLSGIQQNIR